MEFKGIQVPFELVPFEQMNKKQAKQYFEWFIKTIDERLEILQKHITSTGGDFVLDKTPESLIHLWEWFVDKIEMIPKSEEELKEELTVTPECLHKYILEDTRRISEDTYLLMYNISVYIGEVLIENNNQIYWGIKSKPINLEGVNAPRLFGFVGGMSNYIFGQIEVITSENIEKKDNYSLYELYKLNISNL